MSQRAALTEHTSAAIRRFKSPAVGRVLYAFGAILPALLLYLGTLRYGPIWDDHTFVKDNPFIQSCRNLSVVLNPRYLIEVLPVRNAARPAWLAGALIDRCVFGGDFSRSRLTSLLWHGLGAALLILLAWRLTGDLRVALFSGLLFGVHPLHTEAVNIITFRSDLMAFVFMSGSLLFYLSSRTARGAVAVLHLCGALTLFFLGLMSKEMAVMLPFLMLLCDALFPAPRSGRRSVAARSVVYGLFAVVLIGYLFFRVPRSGYDMVGHSDFFSVLRRRSPDLFSALSRPNEEFAPLGPALRPQIELPPWSHEYFSRWDTRALTSARIAGETLRILFWPQPLQGDYAPKPSFSWRHPSVAAGGLSVALMLTVAWALRRRRPTIAFALGWIALTYLPVCGLIAMKNPQAERYLYIPSAGACLLLASFAGSGGTGFRWRQPVAAAVLITLAVAWGRWTIVRNRDYANDETFYRSILAVDPDVPRARLNLAQELFYQNRLDEADLEFQRALASWPESAAAKLRYGEFLRSTERVTKPAR